MTFSVVGSVNHLVTEYRRFLLSTYRLADQKLREQFEEHIKQADVLVKGPYIPEWTKVSVDRLFAHECSGACYGCLKSYRNQPFHQLLDKNLVRDALFQFSTHARLGAPFEAAANQGLKLSNKWIEGSVPAPAETPTKDTAIERKLSEAIENGGRLPAPVKQREFRSGVVLIAVADFAYETEKIAVLRRFCLPRDAREAGGGRAEAKPPSEPGLAGFDVLGTDDPAKPPAL